MTPERLITSISPIRSGIPPWRKSAIASMRRKPRPGRVVETLESRNLLTTSTVNSVAATILLPPALPPALLANVLSQPTLASYFISAPSTTEPATPATTAAQQPQAPTTASASPSSTNAAASAPIQTSATSDAAKATADKQAKQAKQKEKLKWTIEVISPDTKTTGPVSPPVSVAEQSAPHSSSESAQSLPVVPAVVVNGTLKPATSDQYRVPVTNATIGIRVDLSLSNAPLAAPKLTMLDSGGAIIGEWSSSDVFDALSLMAWAPEDTEDADVFINLENAAPAVKSGPDDSTSETADTDSPESDQADTPYQLGVIRVDAPFAAASSLANPNVVIIEPRSANSNGSFDDISKPLVIQSGTSVAASILLSIPIPDAQASLLVSDPAAPRVGPLLAARDVRERPTNYVVDLSLVEFETPNAGRDADPAKPHAAPPPTPAGIETRRETNASNGLPLLVAGVPAPGPKTDTEIRLNLQPSPQEIELSADYGELKDDIAPLPPPPETNIVTTPTDESPVSANSLPTTLGLSVASLLTLGLLWPDLVRRIQTRTRPRMADTHSASWLSRMSRLWRGRLNTP